MWQADLVVLALWVWTLLDYLSTVHLPNNGTSFDVGVLYDTRGGRGYVKCAGPCSAQCTGAKWVAIAVVTVLCATVASARWRRPSSLLRTVGLVGMVAVIALEDHMSGGGCTPIPVTISRQRGRIPLLAAAAAGAFAAVAGPLIRVWNR